MSLHSSDIRPQVLPNGEVMQEGNSFDLAIDQFGIFSTKQRSKNGLKAISNFDGIHRNLEKLKMLVGTNDEVGVSATNKSSSSKHFVLDEVVKAGISFPKNTEQKVDYWRVGWDGLNDDTNIKLYEGQETEFQMTIEGMPVTFFNTSDSYTVKVPIIVPNSLPECGVDGTYSCEPISCKGETIKLVKALNNYALPTGRTLSELFDIYPILSTPSITTDKVEYKYWEMEYCGSGGRDELGKVKAQYPGVTVERDTMSDKFVLFAEASYTPADFEVSKKDILKGCSTCPAGYTEVKDGLLYSVEIEDEGEDKTALVKAISTNVVADSVIKTAQNFGVGYYLVTLSKELTTAEKEAFILANKTAVVWSLGAKKAHCTDATTAKFKWVQTSTCEASTAEYEIMLADDCEGDKLEDLQREYQDLVITKGATANCVTKYKTKVVTDFSCNEGCSDAIVEQVFSAKAPRQFGVNNFWTPVIKAEDGDVAIKCGFEIKAKKVVINPKECVIDKLPFIMTSTRIASLSGGYNIDYTMTTRRVERPFNVLQLERAQDLDNLGGNLRGWEKRGNIYFKNEQYSSDAVERDIRGTQTKLDGLVQYAFAYFEIDQKTKAGINEREYTNITYGFLVPYGNTADIETVLKSLASSAKVPFLIQ